VTAVPNSINQDTSNEGVNLEKRTESQGGAKALTNLEEVDKKKKKKSVTTTGESCNCLIF
jgi:hypothetical protein